MIKWQTEKEKIYQIIMITNFIFYNTRVKADIFIVEEKNIVIMKKRRHMKNL